jgi:hypothetical protein
MKNKNQRELEKLWAEKQKKAAMPAKTAPRKKSVGPAKTTQEAAEKL